MTTAPPSNSLFPCNNLPATPLVLLAIPPARPSRATVNRSNNRSKATVNRNSLSKATVNRNSLSKRTVSRLSRATVSPRGVMVRRRNKPMVRRRNRATASPA